MHSLAIIVSLLSAAAAVPTPDATIKNLLVPNEHGELVYADAQQQSKAARDFVSLSKRDDCDAEDSSKASHATCQEFCERAVSDITGDAVKGKAQPPSYSE
jgi:hypothetical protein